MMIPVSVMQGANERKKMNKTMMLGLTMVTSSVLLLTGCGKPKKSLSEKLAEKVAEKAIAMNIKDSEGKDAKVDISEGKVTIKTKDGESTYAAGEGAKIPADFPKDVYVIKGAKIHMAMKTPQGFALGMKVDQATAKLAETLEKEMKDQGWTQEGSFDMGTTHSLTYKKGDREAAVVMTKGDDATEVMMTIADK